jgi:hypothetical protein
MPPPPETPRKANKTTESTSPGKRRFVQALNEDEDIFTTPMTGLGGRDFFSTAGAGASGLLSPAETPAAPRFRNAISNNITSAESQLPRHQEDRDTALAKEILSTLRDLNLLLTSDSVAAVQQICHRWEMKMRGVVKGRDVTREALRKKERELVEAKRRIEGMEAEREVQRCVVRALREEVEERRARDL